MTTTSLAGLAAAILAAAVWLRLWWAKRQTATQRARAEHAEAERDREHAAAVGAARTAELTTAQRRADAAGEIVAREIRDAPHDPDPIAELRAVDRAARELSAARRQSADGGHGGAPTVPPRRR